MDYRYILGLDDFPPRWHCGNWSDPLGWIHIFSDLATWAAYFTIPIVLLYFLKTRGRDLPFSYMLPIFGTFILACGTGHLIEAIIFWCPIYRIAAIAKLFTAVVSWIAVAALFNLIPKLMNYPSPEALRLEVERRRELQKKLESQRRELLRSNEALEAFASRAGHDLKAPLRSVRNLVNFVEEDNREELNPASLVHLERIRSRTVALESIIDGLVEYSRVDFNDDRARSVNTRQLFEEILDLSNVRNSFEIIYHSDFPTFVTDRVPFSLVVRNLIDNAVKHHPNKKGVLRFGADDQSEFVHFWVRDDGAGISEANRELIFKPLQRCSSQAGHGLGLAMVKKCVEEAGGNIWLDSEINVGTTFHFTWPHWRKKA